MILNTEREFNVNGLGSSFEEFVTRYQNERRYIPEHNDLHVFPVYT